MSTWWRSLNFFKFQNGSFSKQFPADISSSAKTLAISSILVQAIALLASPLFSPTRFCRNFSCIRFFSGLNICYLRRCKFKIGNCYSACKLQTRIRQINVLAITGLFQFASFLTAALIIAKSFRLAGFAFSISWLSMSCIVGGLYFVLEAMFLRKKSTATLAVTASLSRY